MISEAFDSGCFVRLCVTLITFFFWTRLWLLMHLPHHDQVGGRNKTNKQIPSFPHFFPQKEVAVFSSDCHKPVQAIGASHINSGFNYIFPFQLVVCSFNSFNCLVARKESWECQNVTCSITTVSVITRARESGSPALVTVLLHSSSVCAVMYNILETYWNMSPWQ